MRYLSLTASILVAYNIPVSLGVSIENLPRQLARRQASSSVSSTPGSTPIPNSQQLPGNSTSFSGSLAKASALGTQVQFQPQAQLMHENGGNTGSLNYSGPLGNSPNSTSFENALRVFFWGSDGSLSAGCSIKQNNSTVPAICAVDPSTLQVIANWTAPEANLTINFDYSELVLGSSDFLLNTKQGKLYVVHRDNSGPKPTFAPKRTVDIASYLEKGEAVLNGLFDTSGNIWFTTGAIVGNEGDPVQNSTTVGYIEPSGAVHTVHLPNEIIENGISISGPNMFVQSGPSGSNDHANATGYMYAFTAGIPGNSTSITTLWRSPYSAGSGYKPGGFARGSGSSTTLLGNDFVSISDNADGQLHLLVFSQKTGQQVCSAPIFQSSQGAVDAALINAFDGKSYGVIALNDYNTTQIYKGQGDINGVYNNMTGLAPGVTRVDVTPGSDGSAQCSVRWNAPVRTHSVMVLSLQTGLVYAYTQDKALANQGEYVWYTVALNFSTGKEAWRLRAGAGGIYGDNYLPGTLGPDGSFYQGVLGGIVRVQDTTAGSGSAVLTTNSC